MVDVGCVLDVYISSVSYLWKLTKLMRSNCYYSRFNFSSSKSQNPFQCRYSTSIMYCCHGFSWSIPLWTSCSRGEISLWNSFCHRLLSILCIMWVMVILWVFVWNEQQCHSYARRKKAKRHTCMQAHGFWHSQSNGQLSAYLELNLSSRINVQTCYRIIRWVKYMH